MEAHDIPDPDREQFFSATKLGRPPSKSTRNNTPQPTATAAQHALQSAQASSFTFEEQDVHDDTFAPPRASTSAVNSPFLSLVTIHNEQDLMQTIAAWPKYISRIRNRFGAMEGKLICLGDAEIKLLPLQESNNVEDATEEINAEVSIEDKVHCWTLHFRDITSLRVLGFNGCWVEISTAVGCDLFIRFETPAWRSHFTQQCVSMGIYLTNTFPGGEDCVLQDIASFVPAQEHRLTVIKGIANTPYSRTFCFLFAERQLVVFRPQDMFDNQVPLETSTPFAKHTITPQCQLEHKPVAGTRIRSRLVVDSTTQYELAFASVLDRERFQCALQTIVCGAHVITKPPQQQPAKVLRAAWKPANAHHQWFSVKRSLYVGTFNVGDAAPPPSDLLDLWVRSPAKQRTTTTGAAAPGKFAMYVFGLQECNKFEEWTRALHAHLGGSQEYVLVSSTKLWEIGLVVFAMHGEQITQVETNSVATGMSIAKEVTGVQLGNKGGVGLALRWHDTSFCFVNCHLSPHQEKSKERCANFVQIMTKLQLTGGVDTSASDPVLAFDNVFVLGDLNFRVDETFQKVVQLSSLGKFSTLLELDQLNKEFQDSESCFRMFRDVNTITFPPTYRWERGRQAFSNKRDQPPSYTDRILLHAKSEETVRCVQYGSSQDCMISDHRPVAATFVIELKKPFMQWPMHPMQCTVKRDMDADEGVEALLGVAATFRQQPSSVTAAAAAMRSSPHMMMRKTSKQTVQQQQHQATLLDSKQDQDEEDEPFGPFLGEFGSFFVSSSSSTTAPTIEIVNSNLKLLVGVPTNKEAYLRAVSPRLVYSDDDQSAGEPTTMYQVEFLWAQSPALRVKPMVFDPAYLSRQHLVVAIEYRSTTAAAQAAAVVIPPPPPSPRGPQHKDSDEGIFDQIPAPTTPQQVETKRPNRATTSALNSLRRNKTQIGSQVTSTATQAAAAAAGPVVVGYMSIPLKGLNSAANGGEVFVSSPVINNLIQVGTFEGKLKVAFGGHEDMRRQIVLRKPEVNMFCLRTSAMEIYIEDKWKRVFVAVDCCGVLYVSLRVPTAAILSKQLLGDFLTKNATWICDASSELTRLESVAVESEVSETSNRVRFDLIAKPMQAPFNEQTLSLACLQEATKLLLQSVLHMFQSVKRYSEKDFLLELQHALKERINDRVRRRQLEQEIQRKNAELAKKQQEARPVHPTLQSKASFISRVLSRKSSWFVKAPHGGSGGGEESSSSAVAASPSPQQQMIKTKSFRGKMREETVEMEVPVVEVEEERDSTAAAAREQSSTTPNDINDKLRERAKNTTLRFKTSSKPKIQ